jgi:hypothetical protein
MYLVRLKYRRYVILEMSAMTTNSHHVTTMKNHSALPHYAIDFHYTNESSYLKIKDLEGEPIVLFLGDKAVKFFTLLMAFPSQTERNLYIHDRFYNHDRFVFFDIDYPESDIHYFK